MAEQKQQRESVWSVARRWVPWFLVIICLITLGWTGFVFWVEATQFNHVTDSQMVISAMGKSGPASPLIFLLAILAVSVADSLEGMIVVTKRYLDSKLVEPVRERLRKEGAKEANERWESWNRRRLEAEERGEQFDESPPTSPKVE